MSDMFEWFLHKMPQEDATQLTVALKGHAPGTPFVEHCDKERAQELYEQSFQNRDGLPTNNKQWASACENNDGTYGRL